MITTTRITTLALLTCAAFSGLAQAQTQDEPKKDTYIYATYFKCDVTLQERSDEIVQQLDGPVWDAAVSGGAITSWGWMAHHTGGHWRRGQYYSAATIEALMTTQKKVGDQIDAKNKKMSTEFGKICNSHDDYIWRAVAGKGNDAERGGASFSTYYVCDQNREEEADALVKQVFAPMFDKLIADGQLKSWGWNEHIVGGEYRRLATFTATDVPTLMKTRASIVEMMIKNPLSKTLEGICGSHTDYVWEIKGEKVAAPAQH